MQQRSGARIRFFSAVSGLKSPKSMRFGSERNVCCPSRGTGQDGIDGKCQVDALLCKDTLPAAFFLLVDLTELDGSERFEADGPLAVRGHQCIMQIYFLWPASSESDKSSNSRAR